MMPGDNDEKETCAVQKLYKAGLFLLNKAFEIFINQFSRHHDLSAAADAFQAEIHAGA